MSDSSTDLTARVAAYRATHPRASEVTIAEALGVSRRQVRKALGRVTDAPAAALEVPRGTESPLDAEVRIWSAS